MSGITLTQAEAQLTAWIAASLALASGRDYVMADGKRLTLSDADMVQKMLVFWEARVARLTRGGMRIRGGTPT
jgi:hypothetical protein